MSEYFICIMWNGTYVLRTYIAFIHDVVSHFQAQLIEYSLSDIFYKVLYIYIYVRLSEIIIRFNRNFLLFPIWHLGLSMDYYLTTFILQSYKQTFIIRF